MRYYTPFILLAVVAGSANSQIVEIPSGFGNGADTFITRTEPYTAFGSEDRITVKNDSGTGNVDRISYIRFDLSHLTGSIEDALFVLTYKWTSVGSTTDYVFNIYGMDDGEAAETWDETTLSWSTAPVTINTSGSIVGNVQWLGSFNIDSDVAQFGELRSINTPELVDFLVNDTNGLVTLVITRQQADLKNQEFASKENQEYDPPKLILTTGSVANDYVSWGELKVMYGR